MVSCEPDEALWGAVVQGWNTGRSFERAWVRIPFAAVSKVGHPGQFISGINEYLAIDSVGNVNE